MRKHSLKSKYFALKLKYEILIIEKVIAEGGHIKLHDNIYADIVDGDIVYTQFVGIDYVCVDCQKEAVVTYKSWTEAEYQDIHYDTTATLDVFTFNDLYRIVDEMEIE